MKQEQVQIDKRLFLEICRYFFSGYTDNEESIKKALEAKLDALVRRDLYTKYKIGETAEEREKARQEYLDKIGMRESFR